MLLREPHHLHTVSVDALDAIACADSSRDLSHLSTLAETFIRIRSSKASIQRSLTFWRSHDKCSSLWVQSSFYPLRTSPALPQRRAMQLLFPTPREFGCCIQCCQRKSRIFWSTTKFWSKQQRWRTFTTPWGVSHAVTSSSYGNSYILLTNAQGASGNSSMLSSASFWSEALQAKKHLASWQRKPRKSWAPTVLLPTRQPEVGKAVENKNASWPRRGLFKKTCFESLKPEQFLFETRIWASKEHKLHANLAVFLSMGWHYQWSQVQP